MGSLLARTDRADDISMGKYKSAEATVSRHLKKNPKSQPALALRMYLLDKLGGGTKAVLSALELSLIHISEPTRPY